MKIKKTDISSILPIIIKIIKAILEDINKSAKLRFCKLYISEFTVFVKARIANLNDFSKPMLSNTKKVDKINKLIKEEVYAEMEDDLSEVTVYGFGQQFTGVETNDGKYYFKYNTTYT